MDKKRIAEVTKKMLDEVHFRNMIVKFKDMNKVQGRKASVPYVGVFWVDLDTGKVYADKSALRDAEDYGDFKIHSAIHYETWRKVRKMNPAWAGMEYEDVPRGRVVYLKDPHNPKFIVFVAKQCKKKNIMDAIVNEFELPSGTYEFDFTDKHYVIR